MALKDLQKLGDKSRKKVKEQRKSERDTRQKLKYSINMKTLLTLSRLHSKINNETQFRILTLILDKLYNNRTDIKLDLDWRRGIKPLLKDGTKGDTITKYINKLQKLDLIKLVAPYTYRVNPMVEFVGSAQESFTKVIIEYFSTKTYTKDKSDYYADTWLYDRFIKEFETEKLYADAVKSLVEGTLSDELDIAYKMEIKQHLNEC
jgi:hypothetical protein